MEQEEFVIKQISVFAENRPGHLTAIAKALQEEKINIYAFSIAEAKGFGVVRALVDQPEVTYQKLIRIGFMVSFTDVLAVRMKDEPGGLYETAKVLGDAGINIEYAYAYSGKEGAVLILRVEQVTDAIRKMREHGLELLRASDIGKKD